MVAEVDSEAVAADVVEVEAVVDFEAVDAEEEDPLKISALPNRSLVSKISS